MRQTATTQQKILLDGKTVTYTLTRKRVKNLNLRVRADGTIGVSVPMRTTEREVKAFLEKHAAFILSAIDRFAKKQKNAPIPHTFGDGDQLRILGEDLRIKVSVGSKICGACSGKTLILTVKDPTDEAQRRHAAEQWATAKLSEVVSAICERAWRNFAPYGIPRPTVKYRRMTSRWGSCNTRRAVLTFNYALVAAPIEAVEYVVYHEFAHLLYPDHSPAFYAQVAVFIPDWKARRAALKALPCKFL